MTRPTWSAKVKGIKKCRKAMIIENKLQIYTVKILPFTKITTGRKQKWTTKRHTVRRQAAARIKTTQKPKWRTKKYFAKRYETERTRKYGLKD